MLEVGFASVVVEPSLESWAGAEAEIAVRAASGVSSQSGSLGARFDVALVDSGYMFDIVMR